MKYFRSALGYVALAIAACLGAVGYASANANLVEYHLRTAIKEVGGWGESLAKFKAEAMYMAGVDERPDTISSGLTKQSNGFIQKVLASISGEEARIGVGNGLTV